MKRLSVVVMSGVSLVLGFGNMQAQVQGSGKPGKIPIWTDTQTLGNSVITQASGAIVIGDDGTPSGLRVNGTGNSAVVGSSLSGEGVLGVSTSGYGIRGTSTSSVGVYGEGGLFGVSGQSSTTDGTGVSGTSNVGPGVSGTSDSGPGLSGSSNSGTGVSGVSTSSIGVRGQVGDPDNVTPPAAGVVGTCSAQQNCLGIYGRAQVTSGFGHGVFGESNIGLDGAGVVGVNTGNGQGVRGNSTGGIGVDGSSNAPDGIGVNGHNSATTGTAFGVLGTSNSTGGLGVFGYAAAASGLAIGVNGGTHSPSGIGVNGYNDGGGLAGNFNGGVQINGNLNVTGTKSSLAKLENGRVVALYAMESPENWFEDFGTAQLDHGVATIKLDVTFLQTVNAGMEYHVFLTPTGNCRGLYVAGKTPASFEVRELRGGKSSISFDYRVVARRRGFETVRLKEVLPNQPLKTQRPQREPDQVTETVQFRLGNPGPRNAEGNITVKEP